MKATKLAISFLLIAANLLTGQSKHNDKLQIDEKELAKYLQRQSDQRPLPQAIEGPVDPAVYRVGPGDVLRISFWGPSSEDNSISTSVTPESRVVIPSVGTLDVKNMTLEMVRAEVSRACAAKYDPRNITVTADLTQLRLVRAHIFGEVQAPGSFNATALDRISYFIQQAEGWTDWANQRHVEVRHADGTTDTLDMYKLYYEGDLGQDPYVRAGDVIYVPRVKLTGKTAFIEGEVSQPGPHQIAENESLQELLYRIRAIHRWTDLEKIFLVRGKQPPVAVNLFGDSTNHHGVSGSTKVEHGDRIIVTGMKGHVYVHGAVKNPGNVPYVDGYSAIDYVGFAGGTSEMADLENLVVVRSDTGKKEKGTRLEVRRGDSIIVPVSGRIKLSQTLQLLSQTATIIIAVIALRK
ncbi:MAG: SLBB domain-containing protein [candidate division KSB1 bacterium]|nr:SLBB domain-containing protein [candidate division KSB1 bacterium]MDZ7274359.1 SLBB domain-containing protein [candidate division KSB1 bacterium]MDZ7284979.1 SLBB domain-containing protein [candidate division KSB1 bacterium]MDZ7297600.1 SLBB domain-containing protein [candidate division KSB1 bacterium]MDZ7306340.1 SLBB domain-containing protein [candidate division KSB1 bacterium]